MDSSSDNFAKELLWQHLRLDMPDYNRNDKLYLFLTARQFVTTCQHVVRIYNLVQMGLHRPERWEKRMNNLGKLMLLFCGDEAKKEQHRAELLEAATEEWKLRVLAKILHLLEGTYTETDKDVEDWEEEEDICGGDLKVFLETEIEELRAREVMVKKIEMEEIMLVEAREVMVKKIEMEEIRIIHCGGTVPTLLVEEVEEE